MKILHTARTILTLPPCTLSLTPSRAGPEPAPQLRHHLPARPLQGAVGRDHGLQGLHHAAVRRQVEGDPGPRPPVGPHRRLRGRRQLGPIPARRRSRRARRGRNRRCARASQGGGQEEGQEGQAGQEGEQGRGDGGAGLETDGAARGGGGCGLRRGPAAGAALAVGRRGRDLGLGVRGRAGEPASAPRGVRRPGPGRAGPVGPCAPGGAGAL